MGVGAPVMTFLYTCGCNDSVWNSSLAAHQVVIVVVVVRT